jgi:CheY-like chemotaxis protein
MSRNKTILYVDDDEDDREFLTEAIKNVNAEVEVILAENGLEAMDYLNEAKQKQTQLPCLIVLDINMPYLDGRETFTRIQNDSALRSVPVIMFSSSQKPHDKTHFNSLGVEYFTKPTNISYLSSIASHMVGVCC